MTIATKNYGLVELTSSYYAYTRADGAQYTGTASNADSTTFTSDRMSFWQNEVEVAYISNNMLYINEARILSKLYIGNWMIDCSYGYVLKGVNV